MSDATPPSPAAAPGPPRRKHVVDFFDGPIKCVRTTPLYWLGMLTVALLMLLLPAFYLSLIGSLIYAVYYHATHHAGMLGSPGALWRVPVYAAPIVASPIAVFFMIKPFFARRIRSLTPYELEPSQEPLLYAFVERIADSLSAPTPVRIEVMALPNAGASFRRGLAGLLQRKLVLTIGTPLVATMTTRELAGVIAHELGHFAQRGGMILTFTVEGISRWFSRVAFERDAWDERLDDLLERSPLLVTSLVILFSKLCIFLTRRVLMGLSLLATALSAFMRRQMEFNADLHEIRLAGSEAFERAFGRLIAADAAFAHVMSQLHLLRAENRLPDNVPALVAALAEQPTAEMEAWITASRTDEPTGLLSTHPRTTQRLQRAVAERAPGVFRLEAPASKLFRHFDVICKWTTVGLYRAYLGPNINPESLVPAAKVIRRERLAAAGVQAADRYFHVTPAQPAAIALSPLGATESTDATALVASIREGARRMATVAEQARGRLDRLRTIDEQLLKAARARALISAGVSIRPKTWGLEDRTLAAVRRFEERARTERTQIADELEPFFTASRQRLGAAIALLDHPESAPHAPGDGRLRSHAADVIAALRTLRDIEPLLAEIRLKAGAIHALFEAQEETADEDTLAGIAQCGMRSQRELTEVCIRVRGILRDVPNPLAEEGAHRTLAAYTAAPHAVSPLADAMFMLRGLEHITAALLARLAIIGRKVEHRIGLAPPADESKPPETTAMPAP